MRDFCRSTNLCLPALASLLGCALSIPAQTASFAVGSTDFGNINVCPANASTPASCSKTLAIPYKITETGTFGAPKVLTVGAPNLDYTLAANSCPNGVFAGQTCTAQITFTPRLPGGRAGAFELTDASGNIVATEYLGGQGIAPQIAFMPALSQSTVINTLNQPTLIVFDGKGDLIEATMDAPYLVRIPAGCNSTSCQVPVGDGSDNVNELAIDGAGAVYIVHSDLETVLKIPVGCTQASCEVPIGGGFGSIGALTLGRDSTAYVAGPDKLYVVPPGCISAACVSSIPVTANVSAATIDGANNIYYVAERGAIYKIDVNRYDSTPVFIQSAYGDISSLAADAAGNVFYVSGKSVDDAEIDQVTPDQHVLTVASGINASKLFVDANDNLFFSVISVTYGFGLNATVSPSSVNEIFRAGPTPFTSAAIVGTQSSDSPLVYTIENSGNAPLSLSVSAPNTSSFVQTVGPEQYRECTAAALTIAPGSGCAYNLNFVPAAVGNQAGSSVLIDNTLNKPGSTQTLSYSGNGVNRPNSTSANFPNGFTAATAASLSLNNGASISGSALQLTDGGLYESRSAFLPDRVDITSFETSFDFQLSGKSSSSPDADGFMFIFQSDSPHALGTAGAGLGYGLSSEQFSRPTGGRALIPRSLGIKFDLYNNTGEGQSSTGVYTNNDLPTSPSIDLLTSGINLHSGHVFHTTIAGGVQGFTLTIKDQVNGAVFSRFFPLDLPTALDGPTGYVGFTAATGGSTAVQRILNWTFTSTALAPATTCLPNTLCFPNGFKAASGLQFNGTGNSVTGSVLELTNSTFQKSSTFFAQPLPAHTFTTDFDFQFTTGNGDGFTFVAQSQGPLAIGSAGGGLGYGAENPARHTAFIRQSVAVKFDLHNNAGEGGNSTGVYTNGKSPSSPASDLSASLINLHSGHTFHARIKYEGGLVRSTITDLTDYATDTQEYTSDNIYEIPYNIDLAHTYFGFTAGTGTLADTVKILNWSLTSN